MKVVLTIADGAEIESNTIEYIHGKGSMLPGLETRLEGLAEGDSKNGRIPAGEAFGNPSHHVQKAIPREEFPDGAVAEGTEFMAKGENGQDVLLRVVGSDAQVVRVEMRHPLADKDVDFDVTILAVHDRTPPPMPADAVAKLTD